MLSIHRQVFQVTTACESTTLNERTMDNSPLPEPASMPIFILFDTQTGYLYGHLFATGPEDPFLQEVIQWWSRYCSNTPIGVDYPGLTQQTQPIASLSSN
jgi:hypothetical protein